MNEPILSVRFFRTEAGNEPVHEFLRELSTNGPQNYRYRYQRGPVWVALGYAPCA